MAHLMIGADPEFFVRRKNHWIPGHVFECGTKEAPYETPNGSVQVDGFALEVNVKPAIEANTFVRNCRAVLSDLTTIVKQMDIDCEIVSKPSIFLGQKYMSRLPEKAVELGCRPDMNAYTGRTNPLPEKAAPFRTGAGHVHLGWGNNLDSRNENYKEFTRRVVRELDYTIGLPSLLWDEDNRRRLLYGQAGSFRHKPYGLEYRVLSNRWFRDDNTIRFVFNGAHKAFDAAHREGEGSFYSRYGDLAKDMINAGNTTWAEDMPELAAELELGVVYAG